MSAYNGGRRMLDAESNPEQIADAMLEALPAPLHCCPT